MKNAGAPDSPGSRPRCASLKPCGTLRPVFARPLFDYHGAPLRSSVCGRANSASAEAAFCQEGVMQFERPPIKVYTSTNIAPLIVRDHNHNNVAKPVQLSICGVFKASAVTNSWIVCSFQ